MILISFLKFCKNAYVFIVQFGLGTKQKKGVSKRILLSLLLVVLLFYNVIGFFHSLNSDEIKTI